MRSDDYAAYLFGKAQVSLISYCSAAFDDTNVLCTASRSISRRASRYPDSMRTLYWNVPCWGHQLWDINCRMCVCVSVCVCVRVSADISLYCAKNDLTDYPEIVWVCWV